MTKEELEKLIGQVQKQMKKAAADLILNRQLN